MINKCIVCNNLFLTGDIFLRICSDGCRTIMAKAMTAKGAIDNPIKALKRAGIDTIALNKVLIEQQILLN